MSEGDTVELGSVRVALNSATVSGLPLHHLLKVARDAEFDGVGLWTSDVISCEDVLDVSDDDLARAGVLAADEARGMGLRVAEFCSVLCATSTDRTFETVLSQMHKLSLLTASLGCTTLVAVPALTEKQEDLTSTQWREIATIAQSFGIRVALEFPATARTITELGIIRKVVDKASHASLGLLIDTFHCFAGGTDPGLLRVLPIPEIQLVHVSDAEYVPRERLFDYHDHRTFPGSGQIDFGPYTQLVKRGYGKWISVEIWNQTLPKSMAPEEIASRAMEGVRSVFVSRDTMERS